MSFIIKNKNICCNNKEMIFIKNNWECLDCGHIISNICFKCKYFSQESCNVGICGLNYKNDEDENYKFIYDYCNNFKEKKDDKKWNDKRNPTTTKG